MPNAVNFELKYERGKSSIFYHDRLKLAKESENTVAQTRINQSDVNLRSKGYDSIPNTESSSDSSSDANDDEAIVRRYPLRNRPQRVIEGGVPWDAIDQLIDE